MRLRRARRFVRQIIAPAGKHRPRVAEEPVTLAELMRPTEVDDWGYCPAEDRVTLHAFNADRTRTCWTCRTVTPTAVPRG
ncbi:hypothetical protein ACWZEH_12835 [Streptomyces sp. QTS137]